MVTTQSFDTHQDYKRFFEFQAINNYFIVSETEEELYSDEDDKRNKKKKIFSLGYFSQLMNKKIYSDDFDMSSD
jgi:hypothetical protein